jgi:hypothetical protein
VVHAWLSDAPDDHSEFLVRSAHPRPALDCMCIADLTVYVQYQYDTGTAQTAARSNIDTIAAAAVQFSV